MTATSEKFTHMDRFISEETPTIPYRRRKGEAKTSVHWGQRKLLLSEIEFFTLFWNMEDIPAPLCIYAGAAPGLHINFLSLLFPNVIFHCYDTSEFRVRETANIILHKSLFSDEEALKKYTNRNDVFLISDIRSLAIGEILKARRRQEEQGGPEEGGDELEHLIIRDMALQQDWVFLIKPRAALLKFRPPFPDLGKANKFPYLNGYVFTQVWQGQTSTETRLVPTLDSEGRYYIEQWDVKKYEEQLFYHNTVRREQNVYSHTLDPPALTNDYDSTREGQILKEYLLKMRGIPPDTDDIIALSRAITSQLNVERETPKTLEGLRNKVTQIRNTEEAIQGILAPPPITETMAPVPVIITTGAAELPIASTVPVPTATRTAIPLIRRGPIEEVKPRPIPKIVRGPISPEKKVSPPGEPIRPRRRVAVSGVVSPQIETPSKEGRRMPVRRSTSSAAPITTQERGEQ